MGSERRRGSKAYTTRVVRSEQRRADQAEADARSWEAKWLQEKMNAKAAAEKHAGEVAALRQRVEAADRAIAECARHHIDPREDSP